MKYRKKPVEIDAVQFVGHNIPEILEFADGGVQMAMATDGTQQPFVRTLEGDMLIREWDWVIRGVKGEYYPCKPDIFEATYEAV